MTDAEIDAHNRAVLRAGRGQYIVGRDPIPTTDHATPDPPVPA